jgi:predicted ATPase
MITKNFEQIQQQLRAKKTTMFLDAVTIKNFRGIKDLSISFNFPVSVIAGANACGKTTVLFACACAYKVPKSGVKDFVPTTLFPNLSIKNNTELSDSEHSTSFEYYYIHNTKRIGMKWSKGKSWNKSFMGQSGVEQPERPLYLRTLANLTSPSEVRNVLQIGQGVFDTETLTSDLLAFAQRILPFKYDKVTLLKKGKKNLLLAHRDDGDKEHYSEFHMSAGERAILHISKDLSNLQNALVLIDEIEAGLHPFTQQQMMLELQRLALRNNLQIIITSHSPIILDSVPIDARIFLERIDDNVIQRDPYKDIIQKAFYGQSLEKVSVLCEDDIAESFLHGVMDYLNPRLGLVPDDMKIGRDTGKNEFKQHIEAIGKFQQLDGFIFVLDGDAKNLEGGLIKHADDKFKKTIKPLFLPGDIPETWAWAILHEYTAEYAIELGLKEIDLKKQLIDSDKFFDNATDKPTSIMKNKYFSFCERINRVHTDLMRRITLHEAARQIGDIKNFIDEFEMQIRNWQSRK